MSDLTLSIVIISWNTREILRECLASTFAGLSRDQDGLGTSTEVIVVDNASEDGSVEMVAIDFPNAILVQNKENRGFAAANNQGFAIARGQNILLLNSDTIVRGDVLTCSVAYLGTDPSIGAMGCKVLNTDGTVQLTCSMYPSLINQILQLTGLWKFKRPRFLGRFLMTDWERNSEREVDTISGCYLLTRRRVIDQVGLLDEAFFFFGEETDWCRRMRDAGWRLMFAPVGEITHHGSVSARKLNHKRDVLLSQAVVRLHLKHGGWGAGALSFLLITAFNSSRAVFWSLAALVRPSPKAVERARHFRRVVAATGDTWPKQGA